MSCDMNFNHSNTSKGSGADQLLDKKSEREKVVLKRE